MSEFSDVIREVMVQVYTAYTVYGTSPQVSDLESRSAQNHQALITVPSGGLKRAQAAPFALEILRRPHKNEAQWAFRQRV